MDDTRLAEPFAEECNVGGIGNSVHHSQIDTLFEGAPIVDLEFQLFNTEVKEPP